VVAGAGLGELWEAGGSVELDGEVAGGGIAAGVLAGVAGADDAAAPGCALWSLLSWPEQPARASRPAVRTVVA